MSSKKSNSKKAKAISFSHPNKTRNRNWCFTDFITDKNRIDFLKSLALNNICKYICFGLESATTTQKLHLQGIIIFPEAVSGTTVKRRLNSNTIHIEITRGVAASMQYCKKEGNYHEEGTQPSGQGSRTDLTSMKVDIDEGIEIEELYNKYFGNMIRYSHGVQRYLNLVSTLRTWKTIVICFWGKSGTGKTRGVYEHIFKCFHRATDIYIYPGKGWFDGYNGQKIVIMDDFYGDIPYTTLLKILDRYPFTVPIKGAHTNWKPIAIYMTSNIHPKEWYPNMDDHNNKKALLRRFTLIEHITNKTRGIAPGYNLSELLPEQNDPHNAEASGSSPTKMAGSDCNTIASNFRTAPKGTPSSSRSVTSGSDSEESSTSLTTISLASLLDDTPDSD